MAFHSSVLVWKIPWTEESYRLYTVYWVVKSQTRLQLLSTQALMDIVLSILVVGHYAYIDPTPPEISIFHLKPNEKNQNLNLEMFCPFGVEISYLP